MQIAFQTAANIEDKTNADYNINNPRQTINPLLQGLYRREIKKVFHYNLSDLVKDGDLTADGYDINLNAIGKDGKLDFSYSPSKRNLNDFDIIFIRGDDVNKKTKEKALQIDSLEDTVLINSGYATLLTKDKFEIPKRFSQYPELIPQTICVSKEEDLKEAWSTINTDYVVLKGRYGSSGKEVEKFPRTKEGYTQAKDYFKGVGELVAQEFLPEISQGDVRINIFDGEILGCSKRIPGDTWITNIYNGGKLRPVELSSEIIKNAKIAASLYPETRLQGLDITYDSGKFIETNAFPASIGHTNILYGVHNEENILNKLIK